MAAHEQLILDILANTTNAQRGIGSLSRTVKAADDDVMGLARRLDELGRKSADARVGLKGNTAAQAQLDKLDAKMLAVGRRVMDPEIKVEGAARAAFELAALSAEIDKVSESGAKASASGGGLAAMATPMTGLITAGVALAPVLVTVGTGLAGLAAAAYGVAKPIEAAAEKTGGLQANLGKLDPLERQVAVGILGLGKQYDAFQKQLKPEVIGAFNQGLKIAGHLMKDVEPVAAATGRAFDQFLGQVDKMFASGEWQGFFRFMARTARPDMQLLGKTLIDTANALPPLVQALQPLAVVLLNVTDDAAKATRGVEGFLTGLQAHEKSAAQGSGILNQAWHLIMRTSDNLRASVRLAGKDLHLTSDATDRAGVSAKNTAPKISAEAQAARDAARQLHQLVAATDTYVSHTSSMLAATNSVITDIRQLTRDSKAAHASWTGLNDASITLQNDLSQNLIPTVETVIKRMQGAGANSHDLARVLSSDLKPAVDRGALANKDLRDEIFAMAREAGYAGPNKIAPLSRFIDRNAGSLRGARNDANSYTRALKGIPRDISTHIRLTTQAQIAVSTGIQRQIPGIRGAKGMRITAGTTPTADDVLVLVSKGETIVPAHLTPAVAPLMKAHGVPGFASGGMAGSYSGSLPGLTKWIGSEDRAIARLIAQAVERGVRSALAASSFGAPGPGGGAPAANAALARRMFPGENFAAWNYVAMRESGWNQFARNPSSGAYGIAQALPESKYPFAGTAAGGSNPAAQISWMEGYMRSRYGGAAGAAAHERAFNWYDQGGWLPPGPSLAVNNTGRPERVLPPGRGDGPLVNVENMYVRDPVDIPKMARLTDFAIMAASMG